MLTSSVDPEQYTDPLLAEAVERLQVTQQFLAGKAVIAVHHEHRFWEWGKAIAACEKTIGMPKTAIDVGAGHGLLGPTLAMYGCEVTEAEIDPYALICRQQQVNPQLVHRGWHAIRSIEAKFHELPDTTYDLVCSVSVIEHLPVEDETTAWKHMADHVRPGGVLYVTIDVMNDVDKVAVSDDCRGTKFSMAMLQERAEKLVASGFSFIDPPDWEYHGNHVYDYSFASLALIKG